MSTETVPARALRDDGRGRWQRIRSALTPAEWRRAAGFAAVILGLHSIGFGLLFIFVVPEGFELGGSSGVLGVGVGITAYTLGLRHAFDADHIGAIDNTTRKLMADGQRPLERRLLLLARPLDDRLRARGAVRARDPRAVSGAVDDDGSTLHQLTSLIGPSVSGLLPDPDRGPQPDGPDQHRADLPPHAPGPLRRGRARGAAQQPRLHEPLLLGGATGAITKPWQMYPLGCLFGLGFDTATEIALLAVAGSAAVGGLPCTRSCACRSCSPRACRCSTRSTGRS